ncbi:MAG: hypothetical protein RJQ03_00755 [Miltoncostaeaceae bacterium]
MNTPELFIMGAVVTLIVAAALALIVYGAIMDGRTTRRAVAMAEDSRADAVAAGSASAREQERAPG